MPDFRLPRSRRVPWIALLVSIAIHIIGLSLWRTEGRLPTFAVDTGRRIVLQDVQPDRGVQAPFFSSRARASLPTRRIPDVPRGPEPGRQVPSPIPVPLVPAQPAETAVVAQRLPIPRIGPDLGNGRLWVRPLPLPPRELAQRLTRSNEELADSVVTATIQAFLDSIALEPGADQVKPPSWTTEIAGMKVGLDAKYIYIGKLKIPTAVLALLPFPQGGNQSKAFDHSGEMYADLRAAALRAQTVQDFKDAIKEIRERKKQEEEFQKNQRLNPDSLR